MTARGLGRLVLLAGLYALLVFGGNWLAQYFEQSLLAANINQDSSPYQGAVIGFMILYVLVMAIPFLPAAEIGMALIMVFGAKIAGFVYISTVLALCLAFAIGRLVPVAPLAAFVRARGFTQLYVMITRFSLLDVDDRKKYLARQGPRRLVPWLLRHRLLALIVLLNLPGNSLIGGGGGIAMITGLSRVVSFSTFLAIVALAVAPVPLVVALTGWSGL
ncbi:hypothetical protein OEG84_03180 [Hoeflea sp. G2-23]|uniref:TVP38/TMEM64 family membrane protein n=1 Tax=Hoeflea algicola TaxID=2983763 RepID=A0ABT3Z4V5_9HYPH|nr:hypothetical protein [Hoeflea algicola]MCY0146744.1 hypothetical protein [Hoeflea algicola]